MSEPFQYHFHHITAASPITPADCQAIATISGDGFRDDQHTRLKGPFRGWDWFERGSAEDWEASGARVIQEGSRFNIILAREGPEPAPGEKETGKILGFNQWRRTGPMYGDNLADKTPALTDEQLAQGPPPEPTKDRNLTIKDLESFTNKNMTYWIAKYVPPGANVRLIYGLIVAPAYQGRGIGKKLMRFGTEKADEEGVICWVHSSQVGRWAYESAGFRVVDQGETTVVLDDYARGENPGDEEKEVTGPPEGGEWGKYSWFCMVREPVGKGKGLERSEG